MTGNTVCKRDYTVWQVIAYFKFYMVALLWMEMLTFTFSYRYRFSKYSFLPSNVSLRGLFLA